jgi:hypothetical protein
MTLRSPAQPPTMPAERQRLHSGGPQQIDLFNGVTPTPTPAWQDLPTEARTTVTGLMTRVILEHARISSATLRTETGHDH